MTDRPDWSAPDGSSGQPPTGPGQGQQPPHGSGGTPYPGQEPQPSPAPVPPGWSPEQPPASSGGWGTDRTGWSGQGTGAPGAGSTGWGQTGWSGPGGGYGRPGVVPLRPLSVGELLDGSVTAIRFNPKAMLGLSAVVAAVSQVLQVLLTYSLMGDFLSVYGQYLDTGAGEANIDELSAAAGRAMVGVLATALLSAVTMLLLTGVLTVIVSRAVLGQRIGPREAWGVVRPSVWRLLGVTVALGLGATALVVVAALPALVVPPLAVLLVPVALVAVLYLGVRLCLVTTVVVLERATVGQALRRSWRLVGGAWWRTLGVLVLAAVITVIVGRVFEVPFSLLAGGDLLGPGTDLSSVQLWPLLVSSIGAIVAAAITWPFAAGVTVLLYVDRRMRREGLDLELARAAGLAPDGTGRTTT